MSDWTWPKTQFTFDCGIQWHLLMASLDPYTIEMSFGLVAERTDGDYHISIESGSFDEERNILIWSEHRGKRINYEWFDESYIVKATIDGKLVFNRQVEASNWNCRYMGTYLGWHGDAVVWGKNDWDNEVVKIGVLSDSSPDKLSLIGNTQTEWCIRDDILFYRPGEQLYTERNPSVLRLLLPSLDRLPALSEEEALAERILEPRLLFDNPLEHFFPDGSQNPTDYVLITRPFGDSMDYAFVHSKPQNRTMGFHWETSRDREPWDQLIEYLLKHKAEVLSQNEFADKYQEN